MEVSVTRADDAEGPLGMTDEEMIRCITIEHWPLEPYECEDWEIDELLTHVGSASKISMRERALVRRLMFMLSTRLRQKNIADRHLVVILNFFISILNRNDHKMALTVLGREDQVKKGAPNDDAVRWYETREVYEHLVEIGESDEKALEAAWETWTFDFEVGAPAISLEKAKRRVVKSAWPDGRPMTLYEQQIERIKTRLNKEGSRVPPKKGRKPARNTAK
jgi:hypothetical protein